MSGSTSRRRRNDFTMIVAAILRASRNDYEIKFWHKVSRNDTSLCKILKEKEFLTEIKTHEKLEIIL
jgi:hypothetical protein